MSSEIYKCKYCIYNSNRLYNFKRHMMTKHKEINYQHLFNDNKKVDNDNKNVDNFNKKVDNDNKKVDNDNKKVIH
jgi:hypothetical protein